jgi:hypothetical protein
MRAQLQLNKIVLVLLVLAIGSVTSISAEAQLKYPARDFKYLFNNHRAAQASPLPWPANFWPYYPETGDQKGSGINHTPEGHMMSPAQKYDLAFGTGGKAAKWEDENHTCKGLGGETKKECQTWYGHCNGWAGAALYHPEPAYDQTYKVTSANGQTVEFNYMDVKALLSELWLDVYASFDGTGMTEKAGDWIFDPNSNIARKPAENDSSVTNYDAYWDVTPRALFFALTNYIGVQKVGIDIDRFTSTEVWNQPVVGYRMLPIKGNTDRPVQRDGKALYPVTIGIKLYWANDDIRYDFKSKESLNWNVNNPTFSTDRVPSPVGAEYAQDRTPDEAYISRYISFVLFFDQPVQVSVDGTQVISAGRIIGDGMWSHADPVQRSQWYAKGFEQSQMQPDFLWRPDSLSDRDYRNPHIDPKKVYGQILKQPFEQIYSP